MNETDKVGGDPETEFNLGDLEDSIGFHLRIAYAACHEDARRLVADREIEVVDPNDPGRTILRNCGECLDVNHGSLLLLVGANPGLTQADLARASVRDKSIITITIKELQKLGLIERRRDQADKRVLRCHLTDLGKAVCDGPLREVGIEQTNRIREAIGEGDAAALLQILKRLRMALKAGVG